VIHQIISGKRGYILRDILFERLNRQTGIDADAIPRKLDAEK
jgi:hypothetical protein